MLDPEHPLLLGSASPRRRDILASLGIPLRVHPVDVDERVRPGEPADGYLERVVRDKLAALGSFPGHGAAGALLVADTAVIGINDGVTLGKPEDDAQAAQMLRALAGRQHRVSTRFAIAAPGAPTLPVWEQTVDTEVWFRALTDEHIARYVATGEGRDKAGSYAIQGLGAFCVERIVGSYSNVVGLPACEVVAALERCGLLVEFPFVRTPWAVTEG
jgi:septum formation protein